jgi:hypothetical protein
MCEFVSVVFRCICKCLCECDACQHVPHSPVFLTVFLLHSNSLVAEAGHVERLIHFSDMGADLKHSSRRMRSKAQGDLDLQKIFPSATIFKYAVLAMSLFICVAWNPKLTLSVLKIVSLASLALSCSGLRQWSGLRTTFTTTLYTRCARLHCVQDVHDPSNCLAGVWKCLGYLLAHN